MYACECSFSRITLFGILSVSEDHTELDGRSGSSLAVPVAAGISVFIAVLTAVIVIMFIFLR